MELRQLRCFIAVAETLHFGRAAQQLDLLPAALGRDIKQLEESLGTRLLTRSTRHVALTDHGRLFLGEARKIIADTDALQQRFHNLARKHGGLLRIGAIDSAVVALVPFALRHFHARHPGADIQITEDKTARLLPKLRAGRLDILFARVTHDDDLITHQFLCNENVDIALPQDHPLAARPYLRAADLRDIPLIVPERKVRPHSHDLALRLFANSDIRPQLMQIADEKLTILNMVAAGMGAAVMPRWLTRMAALAVKTVPLAVEHCGLNAQLPLAAVWLKHTRDDLRDDLLEIVLSHRAALAALY